jgi:thiol:disulfide interchange protein
MRRVTLVDPEVRTLLHRRFVADIVDCTDEDDPEVARHWHDFHVLGTPTILVVDPDTLAEKARVDHFVEPEALAKVLEVAGAR